MGKGKGEGLSMPTIDYFYNVNDARWSISIFTLNLLNICDNFMKWILRNSFSAICNIPAATVNSANCLHTIWVYEKYVLGN